MISSDKNVETIARLVDSLKDWAGTKAEYLKIDAADKGVRILSALIFVMLFLFFFFSITILVAIAIAIGISSYTGMAWAFLIMATVYVILFLLLIIFRKQWVVNPLVKFFSLIIDNGDEESV